MESRASGEASSVMARAQAGIGTKEVRLRPGVVSAPPALYSGCVALVLVGGRHGERLLSRARCQAARRRADRDGRAADAEPRVMLRRRGGVVSVPSGWRPSHQRRPPAELRGRRRERDLLDRLLDAVRGGESRALVVRGEPGVGKTALLDYLAEHASGCRVARAGHARGGPNGWDRAGVDGGGYDQLEPVDRRQRARRPPP